MRKYLTSDRSAGRFNQARTTHDCRLVVVQRESQQVGSAQHRGPTKMSLEPPTAIAVVALTDVDC